MNLSATELFDAALALPGENRLELAEALLASLDSNARPPLDESWREVIRRRSAELHSGQVVGVPWEDVKRHAREKAQTECVKMLADAEATERPAIGRAELDHLN